MFMEITTIRWQTKIFYKPSGDDNFRKAAQNSKNAPNTPQQNRAISWTDISKRLMREFFKNNCRYLFAYISEAFNDYLRSFISSLARHSNMKTKTVLWHICDTSEHLMCYSIYAVGTSHIKYYKKVEKFSAGGRCLVGFLTLLFT